MGRGYKQDYTRSAYARGAMHHRDKLAEKIDARDCEICGKRLERKRKLNGNYEQLANFYRRKTCGMEWSDEERKYVRGKCMIAWRKIPTNNGMYKGIMHRKCVVCGKDGLSYAAHGEYPKKCRKCHDETREAHNRKPDEFIQCDNCGKYIPNRWSDGRLKHLKRSKNHYCGHKCANYASTRKLVKKKIEHKCIVCGKTTMVYPSRLKVKKTCSLSCNAKLREIMKKKND